MAAKKITPYERASQEMSVAGTKEKLQELAAQSAELTEVIDAESRRLVHDSYMVLKNTRVTIERTGKDARADATAYSKAVIAKEKELVDVISPEEMRLKKLRDDYDSIEAAELARIAAEEQARVQKIEDDIRALRDAPLIALGQPVHVIEEKLAWVQAQDDECFEGDYLEQAQSAKRQAIAQIKSILETARQAEANAARQAELDREEREARERRDAEDRAAREHREAQQAELDRQAAALREQQEAVEKAERDRKEAESRAERERIEREEAEAARLAAEEHAREEAHAAARLAEDEALVIETISLKDAVDQALEWIAVAGGETSLQYRSLSAAAKRHFKE